MPGSWVVAVWAAVSVVLPREVAAVLAWSGWLVMSVLLRVAAMAATGLMVAVPVRVPVWSE